MGTWWNRKTNRGRVVYDRKPHVWKQRDVERVARAHIEEAPTEVPMLSQLADRVLFWIAARLGVLDGIFFAVGVLDRAFGIVRGENPEPTASGRPHAVIPWPPLPESGGSPSESLLDPYKRVRAQCELMIEWLDKEGK